MRRPRTTLTFTLVVLAVTACTDPPREPPAKDAGSVEPDVFDVIRASNSKEAVERLRDRYHEETEHAKLLQARIDEAISAEEALAFEQRQRLDSLQKIRDEVRKIVEQNAALERQLAAELARQTELKKKLEQAQQEGAAAASKAGADGKKDEAKAADGKKDGG